MKALVGKLKGLWYILRTRNFILLYDIKEGFIGDEPSRSVAALRRTDYNTESDFYSMKHSMCNQFGMQIMDDEARIGDYIPNRFDFYKG